MNAPGWACPVQECDRYHDRKGQFDYDCWYGSRVKNTNYEAGDNDADDNALVWARGRQGFIRAYTTGARRGGGRRRAL